MATGECHDVHCAVEADGETMPASEFLDALAGGVWEPDPDGGEERPDDEQIRDHAVLLHMVQVLADEGIPVHQRAVNDLDDGIWEFKRGAKRLTFFDTPGDGSFDPKLRVETNTAEDDEFWWFPYFDRYIRLGHAFPKTGQKAELHDLASSQRVREEDLAHDQED